MQTYRARPLDATKILTRRELAAVLNDLNRNRTHTRANADAYLLSGLVHCAHCGCKMHGANLAAKGHSYQKYVCSTYCRSGKNNPHGCGCHGVLQDQLVDVIVRKLQECVLTKGIVGLS